MSRNLYFFAGVRKTRGGEYLINPPTSDYAEDLAKYDFKENFDEYMGRLGHVKSYLRLDNDGIPSVSDYMKRLLEIMLEKDSRKIVVKSNSDLEDGDILVIGKDVLDIMDDGKPEGHSGFVAVALEIYNNALQRDIVSRLQLDKKV